MLVLTRRTTETIVIGGNIRITVVEVQPGKVKIGIEAPPDVRIDREEVHRAILAAGGGTPATTPGQTPREKPRRRPRV